MGVSVCLFVSVRACLYGACFVCVCVPVCICVIVYAVSGEGGKCDLIDPYMLLIVCCINFGVIIAFR